MAASRASIAASVVILPSMPEGVEHRIQIYSEPRPIYVILPSMPEGVEHHQRSGYPLARIIVILPSMPEGVEHNMQGYQNAHVQVV